MRIAIATDHRGFCLKSSIIKYLKKKGHKTIDYGADSEESVDYPDFALQVAATVVKKRAKFGILICYTGQGMAMTANKVKGIRAAICTDPETARLTRAHNDANILVMPAVKMKFSKKVQNIIEMFLCTKFEGGRHRRRLKIIERYENRNLRIQ